MSTLPLFPDRPAPRIADTSRESFERVRQTLNARQQRVFEALHAYLAHWWINDDRQWQSNEDVSGAELTRWMMDRGEATDVNDVRPRLTELCAKGWIEKGPRRRCRVKGTTVRPFRPVLPLLAVRRYLGK